MSLLLPTPITIPILSLPDYAQLGWDVLTVVSDLRTSDLADHLYLGLGIRAAQARDTDHHSGRGYHQGQISQIPSAPHAPKLIDLYMLGSQDITSYRHRYPKPVEQYKILTFFGHNIVASEGEEWKKFRKIAAPAFSDVRPLIYIYIPLP